MSSRRGRRLVFVHGRTTCAEATRRAKRCCGDRGASWAPPSRGRRQNSCGGAGSREQAAQALKSWLSSHIKRRRGCIFRRAQAVKGCAVGGRRAADAKDRAAARRARDLGMPRCVSYSFWPITYNIRHRIDDLDIDIDTQKTQSSQTRSAAAAKGRGGLGGTGRSPLAPRWRRHVDVCGFFPRGRKVGFQEIALSMLAAARET